MYFNKQRFILIALLLVASFLIGYNNEPLAVYFFCKDALIGLLTVTIVLLISYVWFLREQYQKQRRYTNEERNEANNYKYEAEKLRCENYELKTRKKKRK